MTSSLTSDRDYLEILTDGDVTISTGDSDSDAEFPNTAFAGAVYGVYTVMHNLGSIPLVRAFYDPDKDGTLYNTRRVDDIGTIEPWLTTVSTTTTTKLIINSGSSGTAIPVYYRLYRFGDKSVTSDERIDKIFAVEPSVSVDLGAAASSSASESTILTIPHGQGEAVLNTLRFSEDNSEWHSAGSAIFGGFDTASGPPGGPYARIFYTTAMGYSDATNFYIEFRHNHPTPKTIYASYALDYKA